MGARRIPKPETGTPTTVDEVVGWLMYLCLSSDSRGLGGHELVGSTALLQLVADDRHPASALELAECLRQVIRDNFQPVGGETIPAHKAVLDLLGLTPVMWCKGRAERRRAAAGAMGYSIGNFQRGAEAKLLGDVAVVLLVWNS